MDNLWGILHYNCQGYISKCTEKEKWVSGCHSAIQLVISEPITLILNLNSMIYIQYTV